MQRLVTNWAKNWGKYKLTYVRFLFSCGEILGQAAHEKRKYTDEDTKLGDGGGWVAVRGHARCSAKAMVEKLPGLYQPDISLV